ncbi:MAG: DNA repair protein RadC [Gammaproteobacteria bacterium]|nr:DNA repair protein RadC [Gammaproteobacteria bacterium]
MSIREWPAAERPREKLLSRGCAALSDAELIAILLRTGVRGRTAVDLARDLLARFGGLRQVLEAPREEFCALAGGGAAKFVQLQACIELARRCLEAKLARGDAIASPDDTRRFLGARLRAHGREVFACMFLDNRHRVIAFEELFYGTIDSATVHPREIVKRALALNAAALILAHNHPSGVAEPSRADAALTARVKTALELVDIRVLDHFVVGDGEVVSLAERGLI